MGGRNSSPSGCVVTSVRTSACTAVSRRFHNVYGPDGTWEGGREKAPAAICRKVIHAKHTGDHSIEIWGDGHQTRSFMYIDDCLDRHSRASLTAIFIEPINLGSDELDDHQRACGHG